MLHVAQELDADYVVFGNFTSDGEPLLNARIMRVDPRFLAARRTRGGPLDILMDLQSKVIWRLLTTNDRNYYLSFSEFTKLQQPLEAGRLEQYVRGLLATTMRRAFAI